MTDPAPALPPSGVPDAVPPLSARKARAVENKARHAAERAAALVAATNAAPAPVAGVPEDDIPECPDLSGWLGDSSPHALLFAATFRSIWKIAHDPKSTNQDRLAAHQSARIVLAEQQANEPPVQYVLPMGDMLSLPPACSRCGWREGEDVPMPGDEPPPAGRKCDAGTPSEPPAPAGVDDAPEEPPAL